LGNGGWFNNLHHAIAIPAFTGRRAHQSCCLYTGQRTNAPDELLEESDLLSGLFVAHLGQAKAHGEHVFYRHANIG
jgi:hypothetical protein